MNADILKKQLLLLLFLPVTTFCFSQDYDYKTVIKDLTSEKFYGRGYVKNGDKAAAKYIANVFEKYGCQKLDGSFFQRFSLNVNTFPEEIKVSINGSELKLGEDYLLEPNSGSASGDYIIKKVLFEDFKTKEKFKNLLSNHKSNFAYYVVMDKEYSGDTLKFIQSMPYLLSQKSPVIVKKERKLMWAVGREEADFPIIEIGPDYEEEIEGTMSIEVKNKYIEDYKSQNVMGYVEGKSCKDSIIIVCAHYDHLGGLGQVYFPGGNDNASGTAGMLEMMKYYSKNPHDNSILFIAFGGEEAGLVGSSYYVENPLIPLAYTKFVLDLDIMGSADDGITVVNGNKHKKYFNQLLSINEDKKYIPSIKPRGPTQNSDHAPFSNKGIAAFFIYTRGSAEKYHEVTDTFENLPLVNFQELVNLLIDFTETIE